MSKDTIEVIETNEKQIVLPKTNLKIDVKALAISQDFDGYEIEEVGASVKVRKPGKQEFFRSLGPEYRLQTLALRLESDKSFYLVAPELREELGAELILIEIFTVITIRQDIFMWPVRIPGGEYDGWNKAAMIAAELAQTYWIRIIPDISKGEYRIQKAKGLDREPQKPDESFGELLEKAFADHFIDSISHPVIKRLEGEEE